MSDYRAFVSPIRSGRPPTPVVPIERCRRPEPPKAALEPPPPIQRDILRVVSPSRETVEIIEEVAAETGVSYGEIIGDCRSVAVTAARHMAIVRVLLWKPHLSLADVGRIFRRDHSTIHYAMKRAGIFRMPAPEYRKRARRPREGPAQPRDAFGRFTK